MGEASDNAVVTVERRGAVAIIWLNRPDVLNAISMAVKKALVTAIEELDRDADVRAIVLAAFAQLV